MIPKPGRPSATFVSLATEEKDEEEQDIVLKTE
jgi:hypothetical protein